MLENVSHCVFCGWLWLNDNTALTYVLRVDNKLLFFFVNVVAVAFFFIFSHCVIGCIGCVLKIYWKLFRFIFNWASVECFISLFFFELDFVVMLDSMESAFFSKFVILVAQTCISMSLKIVTHHDKKKKMMKSFYMVKVYIGMRMDAKPS